ncbi:MAG: serine--tRNA ligase, partial [Clostridia bacterium]|nr:serine--tRNA ligase [Clostridia bacterium]
MLDIKLIKENPEEIKARLRAKEVNMDAEIDRILELDLLRRENIKKTEALKAEQN